MPDPQINISSNVIERGTLMISFLPFCTEQ